MADSGIVFLFDENSPHRLVRSLRELGEAAFHVYDVGLKQAPDEMVLRYAGERGLVRRQFRSQHPAPHP